MFYVHKNRVDLIVINVLRYKGTIYYFPITPKINSMVKNCEPHHDHAISQSLSFVSMTPLPMGMGGDSDFLKNQASL